MSQKLIINCAASLEGRCKLLDIPIKGSTCANCKERLPIKAKVEPLWYEDDGKRYAYVCESKECCWPIDAWEKIAGCEMVGKQYKVPRALFDQLKRFEN